MSSLSYREWYRPSPHLPGAIVGTVACLTPAFAPLPFWVQAVFDVPAAAFATWTLHLALRIHPALRADATGPGLVLIAPGSLLRPRRLTVQWSRIEEIRVVEQFEDAVPVPCLEIVRNDAVAAPEPFARGAAAGYVRHAVRGWLPDRAELERIAGLAEPGIRFAEAVPPAIARAEQNRQTDRDDASPTAADPRFLLGLWRYGFGLFGWLLLSATLLGSTVPDLEAHLGAGRPGVWTAEPEYCAKGACHVHGDFVSDDGRVVRTDLALRGDDSLYPAGFQVRARDAGSHDYVYPPGGLGNDWPANALLTLLAALPLAFWTWRVPVRAARRSAELEAAPYL
ncbi:hypothetical protein AB0K51_04655 [Kitasatospora sp. NPDC049285]|uniref:hypothetical protein n=1 Tax=Kitasatospora sp. NPDC049285 TaxID=3157096 RepID=UPI00343A4BB6